MTTKYIDLITSEYLYSPKFIALVQMLTDAIQTNTEIVQSLPTIFDVDTAVGQQLDFVGEWVGVSRGLVPSISNLFFSFGDPEKGFGLGYWKDKYSPTGISILPDGEYRAVIKAKIALNTWDGNIPDAIDAISDALPNNGFIITDYQDMSMTLGITGAISPLVQALVTRGYFDIRPAGVLINYETSTVFFGFGMETSVVAGFGTGNWGKNVPLL